MIEQKKNLCVSIIQVVTVPKSSLLKFKNNTVNSRFQPFFSLSKSRRDLRYEDYASAIAWIFSAKKKGELVFKHWVVAQRPMKLSYLRKLPELDKITPEGEFRWCCEVLLKHSKDLNKFVAIKDQVEDRIKDNDPKKACDLLDEIEKEFGFSLWVIEVRLAIYQYFYGLEKQKEYLERIKNEASPVIKWLSSSLSRRNEDASTFYRYMTKTIEVLTDSDLPVGLKKSLIYKTTGVFPDNIDDLSEMLRYESASSFIDQYTVLLSVLSILVSSAENKKLINKCLSRLGSEINDRSINRIVFLNGGDVNSNEVWESVEDGKSYPNVFIDESCLDTLAPQFLSTVAESCIRNNFLPLKKEGVVDELFHCLLDIYYGGSFSNHALSKGMKLCLNFSAFNFAQVLAVDFLAEISSSPVLSEIRFSSRFIASPLLDPLYVTYLPESQKDKLLEHSRSLYGQSYVVKMAEYMIGFYNNLGDVFEGVDEEFRIWLDAEKAYSRKEFSKVLEFSKEELKISSPRLKRVFIRLVANAIDQAGDISDLNYFIANKAVAYPSVINMLPLVKCAKQLDKSTRKELAADISTPIALHLYSVAYDDEYDKVLSYAYEDFLTVNNITKPSEILKIADGYDSALVIYYLKYICVPQIMKVSTEFNGTSELENERMAVCSILLQLDPGDAEIYESEIKEITKTQVIRKGVRHVEQSKISIDVPSIKKWADKNLQENFYRYQALVSSGFNPAAGFEEALYESIASGKPLSGDIFDVPQDEAGTLLKGLIHDLLTECTVSPVHGLDCYLSMRVRHGALSGQLRGPVELEKIITQKLDEEGRYASNEYWSNKYEDLGEQLIKHLDDCLVRFSYEYDELIDFTANQLVQIKSFAKPEGLFEIKITRRDLMFIASTVNDKSSFSDFVDRCIDLFWQCVDFCLSEVRRVIEVELKSKLNKIFYELQDSVDSVVDSGSAAEFNRALRTAQTNSLQALTQIVEWFKLPAPKSEPNFSLEDLIDVGLQCVQRPHKDFYPEVRKRLPDLPVFVGALNIFSDIFYIIFDNIKKYSNNGGKVQVDVVAERVAGNKLQISVVSEASEIMRSADSIAKVEKIRRLIDSDKIYDSVKSEGGTGLIKLKKIIGSNNSLDFGYVGCNSFKVEFSLSMHEFSA
ncbi:hypothetical protein ACUN9V_05945 [Salinicola sp. V024]|uniref:hypothetical protein n=1 Tax=Salinicola sp. V024 TaxID=3459609 RepID=UPI004044891D